MYEAHFGLEGLPFQMAPDLHFYVDTDAHRAALDALRAGLDRNEEFIALTGEFGAGKTMVARRLIQLVDRDRYVVGELAGWRIEGDDLLRRIASALGLGVIDAALPLGTLMKRLQEIAQGGRAALLVIDDAHLLGLDAVRRLAKLTAMRLDGRVVLHVCLAGRSVSPAIDEHARLGRPLRIDTLVQLDALEAAAADAYIMGRLERVGWKGRPSFAEGTTAEIQVLAAGNPARINRLCGRLLAQLWECEGGLVSIELVRSVAARLQLEFDDFLEEPGPGRRAMAAPDAGGQQAPAQATEGGPGPARRDPAAAQAAGAAPMQGAAVATDPLLDIDLMPDELAEMLPALSAQAHPAVATADTPGSLSPLPVSRWSSKAAADRRRVFQAAAVLLAFGGGLLAWQRGGLPNVTGLDLGRVATLHDGPPPGAAATGLHLPAPAPALALSASGGTRTADATLSLDVAPPSAGRPLIANPSDHRIAATAAETATAAAVTGTVAGTAPPVPPPPAQAVAQPPRRRIAQHPADNATGTARVSLAVAACSLEAQTMGLCRVAQPPRPAREPVAAPVRPVSPPPPPCNAAQSALALCNP